MDLAAAFAELPVGLSLGYALFQPRRPAAPPLLMARADERLYREKRQRKQS
jgi:GGDEF domain-containing protein